MTVKLLSLLLSDLGRDAVKFAAGLVLAICVALAFVIASLGSLLAAAAPGHAIASASIDEIPENQLAVIREAAATCSLPWQVLAAIAKVNADFGRTTATSANGTIGFGQMPVSVWETYGNVGDPSDYQNAVPVLARYLCDHGATQDLRASLSSLSPTDGFVNQVMAVAVRYGYLMPGAPASQVLDLARSQTGKPYVWGGASPDTSFDCSGLVQWAFGQIGIRLPRTAQQQFDVTARVTPE
ncbi:MAG: NlpC/P60 family protein [Chloroflexi bacterium]|nr:NlpC/P60 family protein [Chloroflexota bacterium]